MDTYVVKFLIIRFSSIGDIVLTTPLVRCIKHQVENAEVYFLTKPQYAEMLSTNPYIDKVITLKSFYETVDEIREEQFDYIIDLQKNLRSYRLKNKLKILDFTFPKLNIEKWLMTTFKINKLPDIHIVDRYFEAVKIFDVENDKKGLDFFIDEKNKVNLNDFNLSSEGQFVAYCIGGQHSTKRMPETMIAEICARIKSQIALLGGKEDYVIAERIKSHAPNCINLCGKLNLIQSASVIEQSKVVIAHDTGLMHIASALKKNVISVWGNTIPEFGMYPYLAGEKSKIFEVRNLKCRPCSKLGYKKCPKKHFNCMAKQSTQEIADYCNKIV